MNILEKLNNEQRQAVLHEDGPLLILAGAGSGKTRVLTYRIAYLISERHVNPWNIIALTFTNKAADEMRERINDIVGFGSEYIWVSTFHSTCVRILRRFCESIGYGRNFVIYDTDDSKSAIKAILKKLNIDPKFLNEKKALSVISSNKNSLISPEMFEKDCGNDLKSKLYAKVYKEYQERLLQNNAMDFDDLLVNVVKLFQTDENARRYYHNRFKHILVDEYQDTNSAQFAILSLLTKKADDEDDYIPNICVVGDDDQSIYRFRGANIYNILNFEKVYKDTTVIRLEQNYRSTKTILNAANEVISNNKERKEKKLWSDHDEGCPISFIKYGSDFEEAAGIISTIKSGISRGNRYKDYAILYRTNSQSRMFEENLVAFNIPYKIVGGINFYQRKEIKDILAYLKTIDNGLDDIAVRRIINTPKRGIGLTTIDRIMNYADMNNMSFYKALTCAERIDGIGRAKSKILDFVTLIESFKNFMQQGHTVDELINDILSATGYMDELVEEGTDEANARIENIEELINKAVTFHLSDYVSNYDNDNDYNNADGLDNASGTYTGFSSPLSAFLENVALISDIDTTDSENDVVLLMTLHGSKGLEFPHVFICGMEDGIFPSDMAIYAMDESELEEERRLCYVGITRAMETLTISCAARRMKNGQAMFNAPSRFIYEIPRYLMSESGSEGYSYIESPAKYSPEKRSPEKRSPSSNLFSNNPYISKGIKAYASANFESDKISYGIGDRVKHIKFGTGTVKDIVKSENDCTVTVDFDEYGIRKMKASFAKLIKL